MYLKKLILSSILASMFVSSIAISYELNGDNIADILWRKGNVNHLWKMHADGTHTYKNIGIKSTAYTIAGVGDFDDDNIADIFWRKGNVNHLWKMHADGTHTYKNIGIKSIAYIVAGVADFNNDGISDILWRKGNENHIWYMHTDGTHTFKNIGTKSTIYNIVGVGDFNGDGISDILWRKGDKNYIWYMYVDGSHSYKRITSKSYNVQAVKDFNNDGISDILWRKGDNNHIWYMHEDGTHMYKNIGSKSSKYIVAGVDDFNGDGIADIVWRNGNVNHLWRMHADGSHTYKNIGSKSTAYNIVGYNDSITIRNWTRTNPGAGGTIAMIGATASGVLVTASDLSGIYINKDKSGAKWDVVGEKNGLILTTHMSALGFHPNNGNTFYVGTGRGVYKTTNLGQNFDFISANMTHDNSLYDNSSEDDTDTYVESIAVSKSKPNTLYVTYHMWGDDNPSSVAKSTNGGVTWTDVSFPSNLRPDNLRILKLLVHPQNDKLIYAIAGKPRWGCSKAKAYRSTNGGQSWTDISNGHDILDLDIDFSNQNILYISTFQVKSCSKGAEVLYYENGQAKKGNLYKSTNKGSAFGSPIFNKTGIISVGTGNENNSNNVKLVNILTLSNAYWMDDDQTGTWESNNAGDTWNHVGTVSDWTPYIGYGNNPYTAYAKSFNGWNKTLTKDIFNSDKLYGAGGWTIATFDGGITFKSLSTKKVSASKDTWISTGLENINGFALDVNDKNSNVIYIGGYDIGFWVSKNRGKSWKWQNPFKNDLVTQNRYTWGASENEPDAWEPDTLKTIGGSNVMTLISDPTRPNVVWSSFARSQDFAEAEVNATHSERSDRSSLFRSTNYGDTWTLSPVYKNGIRLSTHYHAVIYGLSIDKSSPNGARVLYVTIDGDVAKSDDDGKTWHIIHEDGGLKFTAVSDGILYAGGKNGLWRFKNNVWARMGGSLKTEMKGIGSPMIVDLSPQSNIIHYDNNWNEIIDKYAWNGVHDIKIDPNNTNIVYVVVYGEKTNNTSKGLYKTTNGGNSWTRVNLGAFESKYLRYITIDPTDSNSIFLTSSENINSGGAGGSSKGILYSNNRGASWKDINTNMAWKYGSAIEVDKLGKRMWAWSPGTGIQYMDIR